MDTSRVGPGEWIAAAGGVLLVIALFFLDWYSLEPNISVSGVFLAQETVPVPPDIPDAIDLSGFSADINAWDGEGFLGTIANLIMLAAAAWAIVAVGLKAGATGDQPEVDSARITLALGIAATVMVALRIIFTPGDSDIVDTSLKFGIFVALIGAVGIAIGGRLSRDAAPAPAGGPPPPPPPAPPPSEPPPSDPPPPPPPPPPPSGGQPPPSSG